MSDSINLYSILTKSFQQMLSVKSACICYWNSDGYLFLYFSNLYFLFPTPSSPDSSAFTSWWQTTLHLLSPFNMPGMGLRTWDEEEHCFWVYSVSTLCRKTDFHTVYGIWLISPSHHSFPYKLFHLLFLMNSSCFSIYLKFLHMV